MKILLYKININVLIVTFCICYLIIYSYIQFKAIENIKSENINDSVLTTSSGVLNKKIVLDAGHGLPDQGTVAKDGTFEYILNLQIVKKLQEIFQKNSATIYLTRTDDNGIYESNVKSIKDKKISDINKRVEIGNNSNADIFVSIHMNYYEDPKYSGFQTFYQQSSEKSKLLANLIQQELINTVNPNNTRSAMQISDVYIMDNISIPTVIVECGFLSNQNETSLLKTDEYQNKLVEGIYFGIEKYFLLEN